MRAASGLLWLLNRLLSVLEVLLVLLAGFYSLYALWDNRQVYREAEVVQESLLRYKPAVTTVPDEPKTIEHLDFAALKAINPDICAWISLEKTEIDYPVLQGTSNLSYISTDVYGNYSLAGSIFLDSRNSVNWDDSFSLIYGHLMEDHRMFGDLKLYRESEFFNENGEGQLLLPDGVQQFHVFACLQAGAAERLLFDPAYACRNRTALLNYIWEHAEQLDKTRFEGITQSENMRIIALATCSTEYTDSRTVVLALLENTV